MAEEFVRKDVFDVRMDRMEALLEKTLTEIKADNEKLRSEMRENNARIEGKIEALTQRVDQNFAFLNMRIESVQTSVYWGLAIMGLILAFATFIPSVLDFLKNLRRPSLTVEDVKLLISETLNSKEAKV